MCMILLVFVVNPRPFLSMISLLTEIPHHPSHINLIRISETPVERSQLWPVLVNKVLLEHSLAHLFCLWLLWCCNGSIE